MRFSINRKKNIRKTN